MNGRLYELDQELSSAINSLDFSPHARGLIFNLGLKAVAMVCEEEPPKNKKQEFLNWVLVYFLLENCSKPFEDHFKKDKNLLIKKDKHLLTHLYELKENAKNKVLDDEHYAGILEFPCFDQVLDEGSCKTVITRIHDCHYTILSDCRLTGQLDMNTAKQLMVDVLALVQMVVRHKAMSFSLAQLGAFAGVLENKLKVAEVKSDFNEGRYYKESPHLLLFATSSKLSEGHYAVKRPVVTRTEAEECETQFKPSQS